MENLVNDLKEFLEVEELDLNAQFVDYEEWDSLSVLSVLALLDSDYGINMTRKDVESFPSIAAFVEYVKNNAKQ